MVMKKVLVSTLFIIVIVISYLIYDEFSFSPLRGDDFQKLFKGYNESFDKSCSKDFLGLSFHGELFDIYQYRTKGALIDKSFPMMTEWEHKEITNETLVGKRKNCPLDSQTTVLYKLALTSNNLAELKCCNSSNKVILNPNNYYCYVYFNEWEQYFLLYCTGSQELYYIRKRGF